MKHRIETSRAARLLLLAGLTVLCAALGLGFGTLLAHLLARHNLRLADVTPPGWAILLTGAAALLAGIVLHELGHLVTGLLLGYRPSSLRVFCLVWERSDGRLRFRVEKPRGYRGVCAMLPPAKPLSANRQALFYAGGLLMNGLTLLILLACLLALGPSRPAFWLLLTAFFVTLALVLPNLLLAGSNSAPTDGRLMRSLLRGDAYARDMLAVADLGAQLRAGVRPAELQRPPLPDREENGFQAVLVLQGYLAALDSGDVDEADALLARMEAALPLFQVIQRPMALYELIYYYSVVRPDAGRARVYYEQTRQTLEQDPDCNAWRVRAAYAAHVEHNAALARTYREAGLSACPRYPLPGQAKLEQALLMNLDCEGVGDMV